MTKLSDLKVEESAKIVSFFCDKKTKQRLLQLGLTTGQVVKILNISVLKKSYLISVRHYSLAIRKSILEFVDVEKI